MISVRARFPPKPLAAQLTSPTSSYGMAYRQSTMAKGQDEVDLDVKDSSKPYKAGTIADQNDMRRVGKQQELRVSRQGCLCPS